ncbi:MAG: ABC transporter substrate-binding protein [Acidimicrobiales bacterium]
MKRRSLAACAAAAALLAGACGSDASTATDTTSGGDTGGSGATALDFTLDVDAILAADLGACVEAPTGESLKIGYAADKSEVSGFADIPGSLAGQHMVDLINCTGGINGTPVEYQVQDVQGSPEVAIRATQDLLDWGAVALLGPPFADFGQPILQTTGGTTPVFFVASTEPSLPDIGALSFLISFDDTKQATAAASYALSAGYTRAITFSSPGPYFGYNPEIFTEVFTAGGGEVVLDQTYVPVADTDFSTQVNEVQAIADGSEILYSAMLADQMSILRGQLEGVGVDISYFGTDAFDGTGGLFVDNNEGVFHTNHGLDEPGNRIDVFAQSFARPMVRHRTASSLRPWPPTPCCSPPKGSSIAAASSMAHQSATPLPISRASTASPARLATRAPTACLTSQSRSAGPEWCQRSG